jgi:hypothetical protein
MPSEPAADLTGLLRAAQAGDAGAAERTLDRQWRYIRAWLLKRLR